MTHCNYDYIHCSELEFVRDKNVNGTIDPWLIYNLFINFFFLGGLQKEFVNMPAKPSFQGVPQGLNCYSISI